MSLIFIIVLSVTLLGIYIVPNITDEEVSQLITLTVIILNFFLSIVFAPWWLQLSILIFVLFELLTKNKLT